jgi:hypothetical protein
MRPDNITEGRRPGTSPDRQGSSVHMDLTDVHQPLTGSAWAFGVLALSLLVSAIPVASVGFVLSALTRRYGYQWQPAWRVMLQAAFLVQICGLVPTVPLLAMSLVFARLEWNWDSLVTLILFGNIVCGGFALGAWRELMATALPESPPSILGSAAI